MLKVLKVNTKKVNIILGSLSLRIKTQHIKIKFYNSFRTSIYLF